MWGKLAGSTEGDRIEIRVALNLICYKHECKHFKTRTHKKGGKQVNSTKNCVPTVKDFEKWNKYVQTVKK